MREWLIECDQRGVTEVTNATLAEPDPWMFEAFSGGVQTDSAVPVTPRSILGHPPIWQGITILATDCGQMPRNLKRRIQDRSVVDRSHVLHSLFADVANPWMLSDTMLILLVAQAIVYGNKLCEITRDGQGRPLPARFGGLVPLPPETTNREYDDNGKLWIVSKVMTRGQMETKVIDPIDTIHLRGLSDDGFWGLSLRQVAANTIGYGLGLQKHANVTFKNQARPDLILEHPGKLSPEAADHLRDSWNSIHQGLDNRAKVAIAEEGMKATPYGISPEEAQLIESMKFDVEQAARIIDIPLPMLNSHEHSTFSNIEELRLWYVMGRLQKLQRSITKEFEWKILTEQEREEYFLLYNNDQLLKGKLSERYEAYSKAISSLWLSPDEVREEEGYDPRPDGGGGEYVNPNVQSDSGGDDEGMEDRLSQIEETNARLLAWNLRECANIEDQQVRRAARSETNFVAWLDEFYKRDFHRRLQDLVGEDVALEYCVERHELWLTLSGRVSSSESLVDAVDQYKGDVRERGRRLLNKELLPCVPSTNGHL